MMDGSLRMNAATTHTATTPTRPITAVIDWPRKARITAPTMAATTRNTLLGPRRGEPGGVGTAVTRGGGAVVVMGVEERAHAGPTGSNGTWEGGDPQARAGDQPTWRSPSPSPGRT